MSTTIQLAFLSGKDIMSGVPLHQISILRIRMRGMIYATLAPLIAHLLDVVRHTHSVLTCGVVWTILRGRRCAAYHVPHSNS